MPALGLPIVRISHRRGSLIPLPLSERREADHTIQTTEWAARAESKLVLIYAESWTRKAKPTLWTGRYTHHTPHFTVSTNLISFTPHPLSRGLLDKHRPCQSPTGQRDIKAWGYCIWTPCLFGRHRYALSLFFNQPLCEGIMRRSIFIAFVSHFSHRHVITLILLGRPFAIAFSFNIDVPCKLVRFD